MNFGTRGCWSGTREGRGVIPERVRGMVIPERVRGMVIPGRVRGIVIPGRV
jgi:hypothetical protein